MFIRSRSIQRIFLNLIIFFISITFLLEAEAQDYNYRRSITIDRTKVTNPATFPIGFDAVSSAKTVDAGASSLSWSHTVGLGSDKIAIVSVSSVPPAATITADAGSSLGGAGVSSMTLPYTVGAGSNKALIVSVCIRNNSFQTVSTVTYGGTPLSQIGVVNNTNNVRVEMWGLLDATPGTANVVVTMSAAANFVVGAVAFSNVGTIATSRFVNGRTTDSNPTVTVTSAPGEVVVDALANLVGAGGSPTATPDATQTANWSTIYIPSQVRGSGSRKAGAASVTMSWTLSASQIWAIAAVPLTPVGITQVMFGATNITGNLIGTATNNGNCAVSMYYLLNPPAGTSTVSVTQSASTRFVAGAFSLANVDQTTPFGSFASATGSGQGTWAAGVDVPSVSGEIVVGALAKRYNYTAWPEQSTQQADRWNLSTGLGTSDDILGIGTLRGGEASARTYWLLSGGSTWQEWAVGGVPVKPTTVAAPQITSLSNYPMLVNLTHSTLRNKSNGGHVENANGYDIIFRASDGITQLDHEIEKYDGVNGQVVAWVRLPSVNGAGAGSDTQIYIYYGNTSISSPTQNKTAVWDPNYMEVWHLAESSGNATDSTSHGYTGTVTNDANVTRQAAKIDGGYRFGGSSYIVTNDGQFNVANAPLTIEGWFYVESGPPTWVGIATKNRDVSCTDNPPYCDWAGVWIGGDSELTYAWDWHNQGNMGGGPALSTGTWYHGTIVFDGGMRTGYRNGARDTIVTAPNPSPGIYTSLTMPTRMNSDMPGGANMTGMIDEVRISTVARSPGWILTSHDNMNDPGNIGDPGFYTVGDEEGPFEYRRQISLNYSQRGSGCGALVYPTYDLSNFPVLISLSGDWLKTKANGGNIHSSDGYDIIFRASDGVTQLEHEIEKYDGSVTGGTLVAWVKVPNLFQGNTDTVIYIYYGNVLVTSPTQNPTSVWDTGNGWRGVWHLSEPTDATRNDSTNNHNNLGQTGSVPLGTGQIAGAASFNGSTQYLSITDAAQTGLDITGTMTVEAWINNNVVNTTMMVANKWRGSGTDSPYFLRSNAGDATHQRPNFAVSPNSTTAATQINGPTTSMVGSTWYHIVGVYDGSYLRIYKNGSEENNIAYSLGSWDSDGDFQVGTRNGGQYFNGLIDEVRVAALARDACWIGTEYNNQSNSGTFITLEATGQNPAPTAVKLISFTASEYSSGVLLRWHTGHEVRNLGFHVYREENGQLTRLTPEPVAGSAFLAGKGRTPTAGHSYSWWDASLSPQTSSLKYWLKDIDLNGTHTMHGPVTPILSREPLPAKFKRELLTERGMRLQEKYRDFWRVQDLKEKIRSRGLRRTPAYAKSASAGRSFKVEASNLKARRAGPPSSRPEADLLAQQILAGQPAVKILVKEEGWYRVTQPELVAAGLSPGVNPHFLQLYTDGREQPIRLIEEKKRKSASWDAVEFYGVGLDTPSTDTRVYWLIEGMTPGKRIHEFKGYSGSLGSLSFPYTLEKKDRTIYFAALRNGEKENFFGAVVYINQVDQILELQHLDPSTPEEALLEVSLQGATENSHRVNVSLNGVEVGEIVFEGQRKGTLKVEIPQSMLAEGENLVSLVATGDEMDATLLDSIRLTYWHTYTADDNGLRLTAQGGSHLTVNGFSHPKIRVIDISDSNDVIEVFGKVEPQKGGYAISFRVPGHGERTLLAMAEEKVKSPIEIASNHPSTWHQDRSGYDLVIVSHREFVDNLQPLKRLRESQGFKVALIDVEDIYDEFSFGNKSPKALRDFLNLAKSKWHKPPRFVLLVGDASFDPRNYLGLGDMDYVPTKLIDTVYMETASDDWFVDLNSDGLPEMAIGRLPVQTAEEAAIIVSKIVGYEKSSKKNEALLVADKSDQQDDFNFEGASEEVRALLPAYLTVRKIFRGDFSSDAQAKAELLQGINQGALLVNFIGHGSVESWRGSLLTLEDAESLINGLKLPFFVNMTCLNGYFQNPYGETLAEALMKASAGGAIAIWTSSGLTEPDKQAVMNKELIKLLFGRDAITLGEATAKAKATVSDQDIRKTWILFGDPTTRLK